MNTASTRNTICLPLEVLDTFGCGCVVVDAAGGLVHATPGVAAWLGADDDAGLHARLLEGTHDMSAGRRVRITRSALPDGGALFRVEDITAQVRARVLRDDALRAMSHDLRSPLGAVLTLAESAADGTLPATTETFGQIARSAELALARADAVLRLLRADAADPARFEAVDLTQIAAEAADECWQAARSRDVKIVVDIGDPDAEALVIGDGDLLRGALTKLLQNAVMHGPRDAAVTLGIDDDGDAWTIAVRDTGAGPDALARSVLLDAEPAGRPRGLGLAFVRRVCDGHGIGITCSRDEAGSEIRLTVPKAAAT